MFYQPQFAALSAFSTIARSNYNSAQFSLRKRFSNDLAFDFNYTLGHSLDNASGLQSSTSYGTAFIVNALDPDQNYASSDFDARHIINANWLFGLPFGRGKSFLSGMPKVADTVLGGWQLTGIFRWNSGLPVQTPFDGGIWATNWNVQSNGVRVRPLAVFADGLGQPESLQRSGAAYQSFRNARSGEVGDRNVLRNEGFITLDMGLSKEFKLPGRGTRYSSVGRSSTLPTRNVLMPTQLLTWVWISIRSSAARRVRSSASSPQPKLRLTKPRLVG